MSASDSGCAIACRIQRENLSIRAGAVMRFKRFEEERGVVLVEL
jgi:hypothetical protein